MNITIYKDVHSPAYPEGQLEYTWDELAPELMQFFQSDGKEKNILFNLWQLKTVDVAEEGGYNPKDPKTGEKDKSLWVKVPNSIRRCKNNVIGLHGLVIDFDHNKTIAEAEKQYAEYEYVIYTTFSHSTSEDKFRMVFPFDQMMTKEEFDQKKESIAAMFPDADRASYSVSQAIYFHSGPDPKISYSRWNKGKFITVNQFVSIVQPPVIPRPTAKFLIHQELDDEFKKTRKLQTMRALITCRNVRRGGADALILAMICKSVEATFVEFQQVCAIACAADSCMQTLEAQKSTWVDSFDKITNDKRDQFIQKYSGKPVGQIRRPTMKASINQIKKLIHQGGY